MSASGPAHRDAGYVPELDGLRAVAILLVMAYHLWDYRGANVLGRAISAVAVLGWIGVDVFFVISGFLITRILLASRNEPRYYASFYIRRSLRIFPLYYAVLAVLTLAGLLAPVVGVRLPEPNPEQLGRIWLNYLYLSNFALAFLGSNAIPLDISWSLAVEEQFYLVYPFVVRRLDRPGLERALWLAMAAAVPLRAVSYWYFPGNHYGPYALPYCRMDALAVGCLVALLVERPDRWATRVLAATPLPLWLAALGLAFGWLRTLPQFAIAGYTLTALASAATLLKLQMGGWSTLRAFLQRPALVAVGKVSYGLYLIHLFVRAGVDRLPWFRPEALDDLGVATLRTLVAILVSVGLAWCSWTVFESPILRLKGRLDKAAPRLATKPAAGGGTT